MNQFFFELGQRSTITYWQMLDWTSISKDHGIISEEIIIEHRFISKCHLTTYEFDKIFGFYFDKLLSYLIFRLRLIDSSILALDEVLDYSEDTIYTICFDALRTAKKLIHSNFDYDLNKKIEYFEEVCSHIVTMIFNQSTSIEKSHKLIDLQRPAYLEKKQIFFSYKIRVLLLLLFRNCGLASLLNEDYSFWSGQKDQKETNKLINKTNELFVVKHNFTKSQKTQWQPRINKLYEYTKRELIEIKDIHLVLNELEKILNKLN